MLVKNFKILEAVFGGNAITVKDFGTLNNVKELFKYEKSHMRNAVCPISHKNAN